MISLGLGLNKSRLQKYKGIIDVEGIEAIQAYSYTRLSGSYKGACLTLYNDELDSIDIYFKNGYVDVAAIEEFCDDGDGYADFYDQIGNSDSNEIDFGAMIKVCNNGSFVDYAANTKRIVYEPAKSSLSLTDKVNSTYQRMRNLAIDTIIVCKDDKNYSVAGFSSDYVFPVSCNVGLMDFGITNGSNVFWYLADNTISTSARPQKNMSAGISYMFATNMLASNIEVNCNSTGAIYIGNFRDCPRLTYYLDFLNCVNLTGNLADCPRVTYWLRLYNCINITGNLADCPRVTYLLNLYYCSNLTGNLADCPRTTFWLNLTNCANITGAYIPSTSAQIPTTFNIASTGLTETDVDNTLIGCANVPKSNVAFTWTGLSRTTASNSAVTTLKAANWTFNPAIP